MSRYYHIEIARYAADVDLKWVDNLLSHHRVPGVQSGRQGVARKISLDGIYHIAVVCRLNRRLGVPASTAVVIASRLLASHSDRASVAVALELHIDRRALEQEIDRRVTEAVEASAPPRRGRPRRSVIA